MTRRSPLVPWVAVGVLVAGCTDGSKGSPASETPPPPKVELEAHTFEQIEFDAPPGANLTNSGVTMPSHYPDPVSGEIVQIPTRIEPATTVTLSGKFSVELSKPPDRIARDRAEVVYPNMKHEASRNGYRSTERWKNEDGSTTMIHHRRFEFADSDYTCVYDDTNVDLDAARALCDSIRPAQPAPMPH